MIRALLVPLLALGLAAAPPAAVRAYRPDPARWRMEVAPELGGWLSADTINLKIKLVDPGDPAPPRENADPYGMEGEDDEGEEAAPNRTPAEWKARLKAQRLAQAEYQRLNGWRERNLRVWFNGSERRVQVRVGYTWEETFACLNGENRLELFEPDSGLRVVRTWWAAAGRSRLQVVQIHGQDEAPDGGLVVIEPNGDTAGNWRKTPSGGVCGWNSYTHANPPAGTYTLRWTGARRYGSPATVMVEATLDGGTERERKWRFSHLMIPGAGPATLGTVDVED